LNLETTRSREVSGTKRTRQDGDWADYPSLHRCGWGLPSFIDMRDPVAYEEWKRTMIELGGYPVETAKRDAA